MKPRPLVSSIALTLFATLGITVQTPAQTKEGQIITFDAPHAGLGSGQGTVPTSINPGGTIAGYYVDASYMYHGFVRDKDGIITTFDAGSNGTFPASINPNGTITGYYVDNHNMAHGFVRDKDGTITTFDVPGAGSNGTFPASINPSGEITGIWATGVLHNTVSHGFLRDADGIRRELHGRAAKSLATTLTSTGSTASYAIKMEPSLRSTYPPRRALTEPFL